jgi:acetyltransferase-like isoleucine patch superfamily enzyme
VTLCNDAFPRVDKLGFHSERFDGQRFAIIIEDGASIGANAVVLPGVTVGPCSMVAAGVRVERDVPALSLYAGPGDIRPLRQAERMKWATGADFRLGEPKGSRVDLFA